jgi:hypothetical protein
MDFNTQYFLIDFQNGISQKIPQWGIQEEF